uniref:Tax1-binding protein 3 n=1 Tax=Lepisosteus oculatus TaxID=7918 RepID=W5M6R8_LEPOC
MSFIPGQPVTAVVIAESLILHIRRGIYVMIYGISVKSFISSQSEQYILTTEKHKNGIYVTRVTPGGPAEVAGLMVGDKIMQVNGWDMTMVTHDQARKRLTKKNEDIVRLLVTRKSLEEAVRHSMM